MNSRKFFILLMMAGILALKTEATPGIQYATESDSLDGNMLIINSYDPASLKMRNNKKELFSQLVDSLKQVLYEATPPPKGGKLIIVAELIPDTPGSDSIIQSIMVQHSASRAIVIKKINAFFNQTKVEVTKDESGKSRTAYYDICSIITYGLYQIGTQNKDREVSVCEYYTQRNVMSGLFAAGPDIVGKKKDAFKIVRKNALDYLSQETFWK